MFIVLVVLFWKLKKRFDSKKKSNEQDENDKREEIDSEYENYNQILYGGSNVNESIPGDNDQGYLEIYDRISMNTLNHDYQMMNYEGCNKQS